MRGEAETAGRHDRREAGHREEAARRIDAAVVQEAEAADLVALMAVVAVRRQEGQRTDAEHAHFLVEVAQVRRLGVLQAAGVDRRPRPIEAEEAGPRHPELGVAGRRFLFKLLVRGILRKLFFLWAVKDCASELADTFHLGHLLRLRRGDRRLRPGWRRPAGPPAADSPGDRTGAGQRRLHPLTPYIRVVFRRSWQLVLGTAGSMSGFLRRGAAKRAAGTAGGGASRRSTGSSRRKPTASTPWWTSSKPSWRPKKITSAASKKRLKMPSEHDSPT